MKLRIKLLHARRGYLYLLDMLQENLLQTIPLRALGEPCINTFQAAQFVEGDHLPERQEHKNNDKNETEKPGISLQERDEIAQRCLPKALERLHQGANGDPLVDTAYRVGQQRPYRNHLHFWMLFIRRYGDSVCDHQFFNERRIQLG